MKPLSQLLQNAGRILSVFCFFCVLTLSYAREVAMLLSPSSLNQTKEVAILELHQLGLCLGLRYDQQVSFLEQVYGLNPEDITEVLNVKHTPPEPGMKAIFTLNQVKRDLMMATDSLLEDRPDTGDNRHLLSLAPYLQRESIFKFIYKSQQWTSSEWTQFKTVSNMPDAMEILEEHLLYMAIPPERTLTQKETQNHLSHSFDEHVNVRLINTRNQLFDTPNEILVKQFYFFLACAQNPHLPEETRHFFTYLAGLRAFALKGKMAHDLFDQMMDKLLDKTPQPEMRALFYNALQTVTDFLTTSFDSPLLNLEQYFTGINPAMKQAARPGIPGDDLILATDNSLQIKLFLDELMNLALSLPLKTRSEDLQSLDRLYRDLLLIFDHYVYLCRSYNPEARKITFDHFPDIYRRITDIITHLKNDYGNQAARFDFIVRDFLTDVWASFQRFGTSQETPRIGIIQFERSKLKFNDYQAAMDVWEQLLLFLKSSAPKRPHFLYQSFGLIRGLSDFAALSSIQSMNYSTQSGVTAFINCEKALKSQDTHEIRDYLNRTPGQGANSLWKGHITIHLARQIILGNTLKADIDLTMKSLLDKALQLFNQSLQYEVKHNREASNSIDLLKAMLQIPHVEASRTALNGIRILLEKNQHTSAALVMEYLFSALKHHLFSQPRLPAATSQLSSYGYTQDLGFSLAELMKLAETAPDRRLILQQIRLFIAQSEISEQMALRILQYVTDTGISSVHMLFSEFVMKTDILFTLHIKFPHMFQKPLRELAEDLLQSQDQKLIRVFKLFASWRNPNTGLNDKARQSV